MKLSFVKQDYLCIS